jgi:predicted nucleic acid-binding protein
VTDAYLDACSIIYLTEGALGWRSAVERRLRALPSTATLLTSRLSRLECRSKPTRDRDLAVLGLYDAAFARTRVVEISAAIIERATELRARYGFRSPDAIHLATAIDSGAEVFITGDESLARCAEIAVDVVTAAP